MKIIQLLRGVLWNKIHFSQGHISFYDTRMEMMLSSLFGNLLTSSKNFWKEALFQYKLSKRAYRDTLFNPLIAHGLKSDKLISLILNFADLGGWGKMTCASSQIRKGRAVYIVKDGAMASVYLRDYGKSKYPVCHVLRGAMAAGASAIHGKLDIDAVETKCLAKGDPYCEFLIKPRKEFLKTENKEYKKQLGLE